jgi:predicted nucleic acid-binding protein
MILYLDTSATVKLYAAEPGSEETRRAIADARLVVTSLIAYTETWAAFARKHRMRELDHTALKLSKTSFEADWKGFIRMPVDAATVLLAGDHSERFGLRAYDAIHLATAERLGREAGAQVRFLCFDKALNRAATQLGLEVAE